MTQCKLRDLEREELVFIEDHGKFFLAQFLSYNVVMIVVNFMMCFESDYGPEFKPWASRNNYRNGMMVLEKNMYLDEFYKVEPEDLKWIFRDEPLAVLKVTHE